MPARLSLEAGDTFAVPLGRWYAVVRVIQTCERTALVVLTTWLDEALPPLDEPKLREVLTEHRGRYSGGWAASWYDGRPPENFIHLGRIAPTEEEASYDAGGSYSGHWSASMARPVLLELDPQAPELHAAESPDEQPQDELTGHMPDDAFWGVIERLAYASPSGANEAEAVKHLAALDAPQIAGFQECLALKLYALDGEQYAREIGKHAFGTDEHFSVDLFLYARCAAVARGRAAYEKVLAHPPSMPKDEDYEPLLTLAEQAYRAKTGQDPHFVTTRSYETCANQDGWGN